MRVAQNHIQNRLISCNMVGLCHGVARDGDVLPHAIHNGKFGRRFNLFCLKPFRSEPKFACRQNIYGRCQEKYQTAHNSFLARVGRLCNSDLQSTFQHFLKQFVVAVDSDHQTCRTAPPWCPGNRVCVVYAAHTYLRNSGHGSLASDLVT